MVYSILYNLVSVLLACFMADLVTSIYHLATDGGYNFSRIVTNFLNHHDKPWTMTFDLEPMLGGMPLFIVGLYYSSTFIAVFGVCVGFAQVPHYYTHHPAPRVVVLLQKLWIFLPPKSHDDHHNSERFDKNFSVINGWSNWLVNWISRKI